MLSSIAHFCTRATALALFFFFLVSFHVIVVHLLCCRGGFNFFFLVYGFVLNVLMIADDTPIQRHHGVPFLRQAADGKVAADCYRDDWFWRGYVLHTLLVQHSMHCLC